MDISKTRPKCNVNLGYDMNVMRNAKTALLVGGAVRLISRSW